MKTYHFIVMSIDPREDPEDNHQKYMHTEDAETEKEAISLTEQYFADKGLPIHWMKLVSVEEAAFRSIGSIPM